MVTTSLLDPSGDRALAMAAQWVLALITGTSATIIAVLAVASVGFLMLLGRLPLRRTAITILGCFVIFGSSAIAAGLAQLVERSSPSQVGYEAPVEVLAPPPLMAPPPQSQIYDPYAGASVPVR